MELIDKDALIAEINTRIIDAPIDYIGHQRVWAYNDVKDILNTLKVNLENSIICSVDWYDGFLLDYTQEQQDTLLEKIGVEVGDKVRIIILKENDL